MWMRKRPNSNRNIWEKPTTSAINPARQPLIRVQANTPENSSLSDTHCVVVMQGKQSIIDSFLFSFSLLKDYCGV
jgi:hypothetical protein